VDRLLSGWNALRSLAVDPRLPRRVIWQVLRGDELQRGARVLEAGGDEPLIVPTLAWLGCETEFRGTESVPPASEEGAHVRPESAGAAADRRFQLLVIRDHADYGGSLTGGRAWARTASLLAELDPDGRVIFLFRFEPSARLGIGGHLRSCLGRHLRPWAGGRVGDPRWRPHVEFCGDPWHRAATWEWFFGARPRSGWLMGRLARPMLATTASRWPLAEDEPCCLWARRTLLEPALRAA